ncbi:PQQ-dependent sugar dehydrogenase [Candidatus Woesebacteria bacterium]|nr:PQQ-dependent sugar dehydrogenase [Candidatus Woesebacteria bacterium]
MGKKIALFLVVITVLAYVLYFFREDIERVFFKPTDTDIEIGVTRKELDQKTTSITPNKQSADDKKEDVKVIATGLRIPWEIAFIDENTMLVTERTGDLLKINTSGDISLVGNIDGVEDIGEGGLLGLALHPKFAINGWIYLYVTARSGNELINRIERYKFDGSILSEKKIIIDNLPGARYHDGGRIKFGPDGYLYMTVGDAENEKKAQDRNLLYGKILRITDEGQVPEGNPFGNEVYSLGHRNPQGLAWDNRGRLWSTEHGPSGVNSGYDELNLIYKGLNYGWPNIIGDTWEPDLEIPIIQSGASDTWAPAGSVYWGGSIFFAGLRGESLYEVNIADIKNPKIKSHFHKEFGRLRALAIGPDGYFYVSTSNTDGRGDAEPEDDKIIRINPTVFRR